MPQEPWERCLTAIKQINAWVTEDPTQIRERARWMLATMQAISDLTPLAVQETMHHLRMLAGFPSS